MKKSNTLIACLLFAMAIVIPTTVSAQAPQKMSYQAVVRDGNSDLVALSPVGVQITVLQGSSTGTSVYSETHTATSNANGLISIEIGSGITSDDFSTIDWATGPYFIQTETDVTGGVNYSVAGVSELLSVPYALYAKTAGNVDDADADSTNEIQTVSLSGAILSITDGNSVDLSGIDTNTDAQTLTFNSGTNELEIANGNIVNLTPLQDTDDQTLLLDADTLTIIDGNSVTLDLVKSIDDLTDGKTDASGSSVFLGMDAGLNDDGTSNANVGVGNKTLLSNTSGFSNVAIGDSSLYYNTTGSSNTAVGKFALSSNTIKNGNTGIGAFALKANTDGWGNTGIGASAIGSNISGNQNTSMGYASLQFNEIGHNNTASGFRTLRYNISGTNNTASGFEALTSNTVGIGNTASGVYSSRYTDATGNSSFGMNSLYNNTLGEYNTAIGYRAFYTGATYVNSSALGYNTAISGSNQIHFGNASITEIKGQVNFTTYSDGRIKDNVTENVKGLEFIVKLRPVTYNFNVDKQNQLMGIQDSNELPNKYAIEKIQYTGFIAQEVEKAAKEANYNFSGVKTPKTDKELYGISYAEFVVPLVKAIQEQQEIIEAQKLIIEDLLKRVKELEGK